MCFCLFVVLSVPKVSVVINIETNQVELQPADGEKSLLSSCVQHESDGRCQVGGVKAEASHSPNQQNLIKISFPFLHTLLSLICSFTELERDEHLAALCYTLHVFPGNIFDTIMLCVAWKVCVTVRECACFVCSFLRYGMTTIRAGGDLKFAPFVPQVRGSEG